MILNSFKFQLKRKTKHYETQTIMKLTKNNEKIKKFISQKNLKFNFKFKFL